jgi:hypothetical protein
VPYVPNHERIDLGLVAYGSDVPQDVLDAAIAAREARDAEPEPAPEPAPAPRKRARTPKGQLKADDPTTPEVNEAWEDG